MLILPSAEGLEVGKHIKINSNPFAFHFLFPGTPDEILRIPPETISAHTEKNLYYTATTLHTKEKVLNFWMKTIL
jgi:hypothetical protein